MEDCLFCGIVSNRVTSNKVYEDEDVLAFWDIKPSAPIHILVIPKKHLTSINELDSNDLELWGNLLKAVQLIAKEEKIDQDGYRMVINTGSNGGQTVNHLHLHLLGGRNLKWPPG